MPFYTFASFDMKTELKNYINDNKSRFVNELMDLLRIPSISADPQYAGDVLKTAEAVRLRLEESGADNTKLFSTGGHPLVYGEKLIDENLPTVLVYGHYDVQPPDPLDLWITPPFEPEIRDEKIYARGACDDKGQMYMHVKAFEAMMKTDTLPCNVKFMIEGEEEVGSANLGTFLENNQELLKADVILISDTSMLANDTPSVTVGLRGLAYLEVEVTGPNRDLHSGLYGGAVPNPINILCEMIASLKDEQKKYIKVKGFYDNVVELSKEERAEMGRAPFDLETYKNSIGIPDIVGEEGYTTLERSWIRPTLDVNGIWGGYTGEGSKTVIPSKAFAKISMRLVPNQTSEEIMEKFQAHFESIAPSSVRVLVKPHHGGDPVVTPLGSVAYQAANKAMEESFGKRPIPIRSGGSVPIVSLFKSILGLDSILLGFGLDTDAIHSPNEHYGLFNFYKGIETIPLFYQHFTELSKKK
jgi:acetylornithine deacetylase/succinyl-diaminopimelate desuccinylase-like protein